MVLRGQKCTEDHLLHLRQPSFHRRRFEQPFERIEQLGGLADRGRNLQELLAVVVARAAIRGHEGAHRRGVLE